MPLPIIANTVRCAVRGKCSNGQRWVNVLHFEAASPPIAMGGVLSGLDPLLDRLYSGAAFGTGSNLLSHCPNALTMDDIIYTILDGTTASSVVTHAHNGTGGAGDPMPAQLSAVVTLRTPFRGRSHLGRVYMPQGVEVDNTAGGVIAAATVTSYVAEWTAFNTAALGAGYVHVVASYKLASNTTVSSYTMDNLWDRQNRRKS